MNKVFKIFEIFIFFAMIFYGCKKVDKVVSNSAAMTSDSVASAACVGPQTVLNSSSGNLYKITNPNSDMTYSWSADSGSITANNDYSAILFAPTLTAQENYKQLNINLKVTNKQGASSISSYPVIIVKNIPDSSVFTQNYIFNGSFEIGQVGFELNKHMNPKINTLMKFDPLTIDVATASGTGSGVLNIPNNLNDAIELFSKSFPLVLGNTYNFSVYVKTTSATPISASLLLLSSDWKVTGGRTVSLSNTWQRVHFNFVASSYNAYATDFTFSIRSNWDFLATNPHSILVDQLQVTAGATDSAAYQSQAEVEVAAVSSKRVYIDDETIQLTVSAINNTAREIHGSISLKSQEDESATVSSTLESWPVILLPKEKKIVTKIVSLNRFAAYDITPVAVFDGTSKSIAASFAKVGKYVRSSSPISLENNFVVGLNTAFFQAGPAHTIVSNNESLEQYVNYLGLMGTRIVRLWDNDPFVWSGTEPTQDNLDFSLPDYIVNKLYSNGIQPLPVLIGAPFLRDVIQSASYPNCRPTSSYKNIPSWVVAQSTDTTTPSNYFLSNCLISTNPPANIWKNRVDAIVNRYKDKIKYWEINNEANLFSLESDYVPFLKQTSQAIKTIDPMAKVLGYCFNMGDNSAFTYFNNALGKEGLDSSDIFSFHPYSASNLGMTSGWGAAPADTAISNLKRTLSGLGHSNMTIWNSENYYLSDPNQVVAIASDSGTSKVVKPRHVAQRFLTDLGEGVSQSIAVQTISVLWRRTLNPNFSNFFNSSLTPSSHFVAYNALARMFEGAKPISKKKWNSKSVCYVYERAGKPLAACWVYAQSAANATLNIVGQPVINSYDVFGNNIGNASNSFSITPTPIYLIPDSSLSTSDFSNLIQNASML